MGLEFIDRTLRTAGLVLLIFLPFGLYYFGVYPALAIFTGGVWGMLNLLFLARLARTVIRPDGPDVLQAVLYGVVKFPLLYAAGYFLLTVSQFNPLHLVIGFTGLLGIIVLKAAGRVMFPEGEKQIIRRLSTSEKNTSSNAQGIA